MEAKKHVAGAEPNYLFEHYQEDGNWGLQRTLPEPKLLLLSSHTDTQCWLLRFAASASSRPKALSPLRHCIYHTEVSESPVKALLRLSTNPWLNCILNGKKNYQKKKRKVKGYLFKHSS